MPPRPPHHGPPGHRHIPASAITAFVEPSRIDRLLAPFVDDAEERAFVVRCLLAEGPAHHRGANFVLLALLERLVELTGGPPRHDETGPAHPVPMRLPPHLAEERGSGDPDVVFPLGVPASALDRLAARDTPAREAMLDCLTDGPPQHALANAAMVALLEVALARLERGTPRKGP